MTMPESARKESREVPLGRRIRQLPLGTIAARFAIIVIVSVVLFVVVYPLIWLFLASLKAEPEFSTSPVYALPEGLAFDNYVLAWTRGKIGLYFLNSLLVVFPALAAIIVLSTSTAFALEFMRWRGRNTILLLFIGGILVPLQMVLLPLFTIYFETGLIDTRWSLIITYVAFGLPLSIFLMAGYFRVVPKDLMEAALIDGANLLQAFYRIAVPLAANAIVTVALVQFFFLWNDLLFSLTFVNDAELKTVQTGLLAFTGEFGRRQWGPTFASISLAVFPTLVLYLLLNRRIIKGLTAGAVKG